MIMDSTNKRVDSLLSELHELKVSLNFPQGDIDELKKQQSSQYNEYKGLSKQVNELKSVRAVKVDNEQMDYLGNQMQEEQSCDKWSGS